MHMDTDKPQPIPVTFERTEPLSADFGAWQTYLLTGLEAPQQILKREDKRARAVITVQSAPLTPAVIDGYVVVGARGQCMNPAGGAGGVLLRGQTIEVRSKSEVWLVGDGSHALTVTVLDERYG